MPQGNMRKFVSKVAVAPSICGTDWIGDSDLSAVWKIKGSGAETPWLEIIKLLQFCAVHKLIG